MRGPALVMVGIAVVVGGVTVIGGRYYMERANSRPVAAQPIVQAPAIKMATIVVAAQPLRFGMELSSAQLKEVPWPADALPAGGASTIQEFLTGPEKRVVLSAMDANEPVLRNKVTGPGERATLSAVISPGMTAVTIPLSETQGLAGLAMPGDRVNVMLTRTVENSQSYTDVLLQNVRVIAIDQVMDQRNEKPLAIRHATIEVMPQDAKRVALATVVGSMSLMLRKAGEQTAGAQGRIGIKDLFLEGSEADTTASYGRKSTVIKVTRNGKTEEYSVPTDKTR